VAWFTSDVFSLISIFVVFNLLLFEIEMVVTRQKLTLFLRLKHLTNNLRS